MFGGVGHVFCVIHMRQMVQEMWLTRQILSDKEYLAYDGQIFKSS